MKTRDEELRALKDELKTTLGVSEEVASRMTNETRLLLLLADLRAALGVGETLMQNQLVERAREIRLGHDRYEKVRRLSPAVFTRLWKSSLLDNKKFDELVDKIGLPN